ncbi:MAG: ABC transporter permease [Nocardioides sp.]
MAGYLFMPVLIVVVLALLYLDIHGKTLSRSEANRLNRSTILQATWRHIELTAVSTALVLLVAIPLGVLLTRRFARPITPAAIAVFNLGQAIPSIGLLFLFAIVWDIGFWPVIIALLAYTTLPVLRNTMVGLTQVDESVIESARGMGMTKTAVLMRIELPLAVPIILAGLRTALTINVGTATLGALVGSGGLGLIIVAGIAQNRPGTLVLSGAVLVAALALIIDYLAGLAEDLLRPKGL